MQFDLISNLHIETWSPDQQVKWQGLGTSLVALVLGNVSASLNKSYQTVIEISKHYKHLIFLDGDLEHDGTCPINETREIIKEKFNKYRNITYLYRNSIILDNVAFIGSHGWYSFDFCEPIVSKQQCFHALIDQGMSQDRLFDQWEMAMEDAAYIASGVEHFSRDKAVDQVVVATYSCPQVHILPQPKTILDQQDLGSMGSSFFQEVYAKDKNKKIKTWAFGNHPNVCDQTINGIRYVCNPRGTPATSSTNYYYYPMLVKN